MVLYFSNRAFVFSSLLYVPTPCLSFTRFTTHLPAAIIVLVFRTACAMSTICNLDINLDSPLSSIP